MNGADDLAVVAVEGDATEVIVVLVGEIDSSNADTITSTCITALGAGQRTVLDLMGVTYLDSAGLRMLLQINAAAQATAREVTIAMRRGGVIHRLHELSGLDEVLLLELRDA